MLFCCRHMPGCDCYVCIDGKFRSRGKRGKCVNATQPNLPITREESEVKRPNPGEQYKKVEPKWVDHDFESLYPNLTEYLTAESWDDGKARRTSTLLVFFEAGSLKLCLNDRDSNRSAFFCEGTMADTLARIESALTDGTVEWRNRGYVQGGGNKTPF